MSLDVFHTAAPPNSNLEKSFRQFSNPLIGFDDSVLTTICATFFGRIAFDFLDQFGEQIRAHSSGLLEFARTWLSISHTAHDYWHWTLGPLETDNCELQIAPTVIAAQFALWMLSRGASGEWEAAFDEPVKLRYGGWMLPATNSLRVVRAGPDGTGLALWLAEGRRIELPDTHEMTDLPEVEPLKGISLHSGKGIMLLARDAAPHWLWRSELQRGAGIVEQIEESTLHVFKDAVELLRVHSNPYYLWVSRMVNNIVVRRPESNGTASGSTSACPGLISVSIAPYPAVAEMLVHEASHQYFNIVRKVGAVVDPCDTRMYYSPAVKKERSLERILLAYHAFANVLLMYKEVCVANTVDIAYCTSAMSKLEDDVRQLETPLHNNASLTCLGRALCEPLIQRTTKLK